MLFLVSLIDYDYSKTCNRLRLPHVCLACVTPSRITCFIRSDLYFIFSMFRGVDCCDFKLCNDRIKLTKNKTIKHPIRHLRVDCCSLLDICWRCHG